MTFDQALFHVLVLCTYVTKKGGQGKIGSDLKIEGGNSVLLKINISY